MEFNLNRMKCNFYYHCHVSVQESGAFYHVHCKQCTDAVLRIGTVVDISHYPRLEVRLRNEISIEEPGVVALHHPTILGCHDEAPKHFRIGVTHGDHYQQHSSQSMSIHSNGKCDFSTKVQSTANTTSCNLHIQHQFLNYFIQHVYNRCDRCVVTILCVRQLSYRRQPPCTAFGIPSSVRTFWKRITAMLRSGNNWVTVPCGHAS